MRYHQLDNEIIRSIRKPTDTRDPVINRLTESAYQYAQDLQTETHIDVKPRLKLAVVTCMDGRIDLFGILGLKNGEAHVLRNAGGVVTDDVIRSLVISQRVLDTESILLIHHTDCGLQKITDDGFNDQIENELGIRPPWALEAFKDPFFDVKQSAVRLQRSPFLKHQLKIFGFVYDVDSHELIPVEIPPLG